MFVLFSKVSDARHIVDANDNPVEAALQTLQLRIDTEQNIGWCQCYTSCWGTESPTVPTPMNHINLFLEISELCNLKVCFQDKSQWMKYWGG